MAISYKKLWKLLIDRDMKKKDLMAISGVSQSSVTKMGKNENVNTDVLVRICLALQSSKIVDTFLVTRLVKVKVEIFVRKYYRP